ncbi:hypothetical protein ASPZODRAFT_143778 [Penicilliopsis zonata CBS 506.65]|uniref:DUF1749-domain-containing protein n=1 Tax=Penicilliopsis zonata CBS 506.65 TaxID=1073090 RepID=A0A1L9SFD5_9EURO|nr:hypothetical protein ASPZODRAFT_143778 [Penicilliopsis zonata CBS 506.65]OJJ45911.1 hypothetical protein ASPZODRAFT_143778 [Penicilliopsis zonata CBS 506.65]
MAINGTLHKYNARHVAFEHATKDSPDAQEHLLLYIGGLTDGLLTTPYTTLLAQSLPKHWTLAQPLLASSYEGFGCASLQTDAQEVAECVSYFRTKQKKKTIALLGCSTGCQDIMTYLLKADSPAVQGGMLQASASDREAMGMFVTAEQMKIAVDAAQALVDRGMPEEIVPKEHLPKFMTTPMTARRFLSLASPNHDSEDDMFSSDLSDEQLARTFGALPASTPLCIFYSGNDQFVPATVDKEKLVQRWVDASRRGNSAVDEEFSGVILGATHTLEGSPEKTMTDFFGRVTGFLRKIEQ